MEATLLQDWATKKANKIMAKYTKGEFEYSQTLVTLFAAGLRAERLRARRYFCLAENKALAKLRAELTSNWGGRND